MKSRIAVLLWLTLGVAFPARAQNRGAAPAAGYPQRPPAEAAVLERGRMLYSTTCAFCHGEDARGGDGGPNLLRTEVVLNDDKGELIGNVLRNGINAMPKFEFTNAQIADIAAFIHSFRVAGYDASRQRPTTIVVGDVKAGEAYFQSKCAGCHEVTGDLKNIGSRFPDARTLQQWWLVPGGGGGRGPANTKLTPAAVTVTLPSGQQVSGRLVRIDDFIVTLADADTTQHTFRRDGNIPKVEVHDPLQTHKEFLRIYADKDIHNVTAYLDSLK
jgi:cytochrome c oxidase cbb3-type subunit 3